MSKPKPLLQPPGALPKPPATLPNGDLDCDADPGAAMFEELQKFSVGPPEVLARRRRRSADQTEAEDQAAAIATASELARAKVQMETQSAAGGAVKSVPPTTLKRRRGRRKSAEIVRLEKALQKIRRNMPQGGTLEEWCERLKDQGIKLKIPTTATRAGHEIEYRDALKQETYFERVRSRLRRAVPPHLLLKT